MAMSRPGWRCSVKASVREIMQSPQTVIPYLSSWIRTRRWSGLVGVDRLGMKMLDSLTFSQGLDFLVFLTFVEADGIKSGEKIRRGFFLPLFLTTSQSYASDYKEGTIIDCVDGKIRLVEAELTHHYNKELLNAFRSGKVFKTSSGGSIKFKLRSVSKLDIDLGEDISEPIVLGGGDTTNIIVKVTVDDYTSVVSKSYKVITEVNPEPEFLEALADLEFRYAPRLLGKVTYKPQSGKSVVIEALEEFVENDGDGGKPFVDDLMNRLQCMRAGTPQSSDFSIIESGSRNLGKIMAEFHYAIYRCPKKGFRSEPITSEDVKEQIRNVKRMLHEALRGIEVIEDDHKLTSSARKVALTLARRVETSEREIMKRMEILTRTVGMKKIRTHQDLHLAQTLSRKTASGYDFDIIDFEGDPQRSGLARKRKESPLRDLGTMARSFGYIKFLSLAEVMRGFPYSEALAVAASISEKKRKHALPRLTLDMEPDPVLVDLVKHANRWEEKVEEAMLDGYIQRSRHLMAPYIPPSESDRDLVRSLVTAWKIEKALLETMYELSHRIQNIIIPLDGILACIDRYP